MRTVIDTVIHDQLLRLLSREKKDDHLYHAQKLETWCLKLQRELNQIDQLGLRTQGQDPQLILALYCLPRELIIQLTDYRIFIGRE